MDFPRNNSDCENSFDQRNNQSEVNNTLGDENKPHVLELVETSTVCYVNLKETREIRDIKIPPDTDGIEEETHLSIVLKIQESQGCIECL